MSTPTGRLRACPVCHGLGWAPCPSNSSGACSCAKCGGQGYIAEGAGILFDALTDEKRLCEQCGIAHNALRQQLSGGFRPVHVHKTSGGQLLCGKCHCESLSGGA